MTATIVRLLPADEHAILNCYVKEISELDNFDALYDALEVPADAKSHDWLSPLRKFFCITFKEGFRSGRQ